MADTQKRRWMLTINNEARSLEELAEYTKNLEHFKYAMFQREEGEEKHTPHIQMFLVFNIAKRFSTVQNYFPRAHIEAVIGTNAQARDYCSKQDTRIEGPVEIGTFAEERSRTDISNFMELVNLNATNEELATLYPKLYLDNINKIETLKEKRRYDEFKSKLREVEVTYLYGRAGIGKTSYIVSKHTLGTFYSVPFYGNGNFDSYNGEDVIVFDEFTGEIKINLMNKLLDIYPMQLPSRYSNKVACYTKVYIVSNLPISELYKNDRENGLFEAFLRRIHNIIRMDENGMHIEKETKVKLNIKK